MFGSTPASGVGSRALAGTIEFMPPNLSRRSLSEGGFHANRPNRPFRFPLSRFSDLTAVVSYKPTPIPTGLSISAQQRCLVCKGKVGIFEQLIHQDDQLAHDGGEGNFGGFARCD